MRAFFIFSIMSNHTNEHAWEQIGNALHREFEFRTFSAAIAFVIAVGREAELQNHHPDINVRYTKVSLRSTTHDKGNVVTFKDHELAKKIDSFYQL